MPKPSLTALQRRAHKRSTLTRAGANELLRDMQAPYVHVGQERYMPLAAAVSLLGLDDALTLVEDKRGLLRWRVYPQAVHGALTVAVALGAGAMSDEEQAEISRLSAVTDAHLLPERPHASPLYRRIREVAADHHGLRCRADAGEAPSSVWRLRPEVLRRLLLLISDMQAALLLRAGPGDPQALTPERLRVAVAEYITNPEVRARNAIAQISREPGTEPPVPDEPHPDPAGSRA